MRIMANNSLKLHELRWADGRLVVGCFFEREFRKCGLTTHVCDRIEVSLCLSLSSRYWCFINKFVKRKKNCNRQKFLMARHGFALCNVYLHITFSDWSVLGRVVLTLLLLFSRAKSLSPRIIFNRTHMRLGLETQIVFFRKICESETWCI